MKKIFFLIVTLIFLSCNDSDVTPTDPQDDLNTEIPTFTQQILNKYYSDAAYIVYTELITDSVLKATQGNLDLNAIWSIYEDFILIHKNSNKLGQTFLKYFLGANNINAIQMYAIVSRVDSLRSWLPRILEGIHGTGLESIDSIMFAYNLKIAYPPEPLFDGGYEIELYSSLPHNNNALANKLTASGEFIIVSPNGAAGDAGSISYKKTNGVRVYTYRVGWGDCEAGCMYNHYWEVSVDINNNVSLIKEYGADLPPSGN